MNFAGPSYRVAADFPEDCKVNREEWLQFLELARCTAQSEAGNLPLRFWDILNSLIVRGQPPASAQPNLITMGNSGAAEFNTRCQQTHQARCFKFTAKVECCSSATAPSAAEVAAFLKRRSLPGELQVCAGDRVLMRTSAKSSGLAKGTELTVHATVSQSFTALPGGLPLLLPGGGRYLLKPSKLEMKKNVFVMCTKPHYHMASHAILHSLKKSTRGRCLFEEYTPTTNARLRRRK